jgi:quinol monooxygenase YgiN
MQLMHTFAEWVDFQRQDKQGETTMATMLIQHKIKDYAEWKKVFDSVAGMRTSSGELSAQVYRDASDPNNLTVLNKWNSMENAKKFAHSPELKSAMEKAGVVGQPNVSFLNEA